jgi:hypothetical protein
MIEVKQLRHMMCADVRCKGWVGCRDLRLNDTVSFLPLGPQDFSHSSALLSAAAERVWEVFIQNKREVCGSILVLLHLGYRYLTTGGNQKLVMFGRVKVEAFFSHVTEVKL